MWILVLCELKQWGVEKQLIKRGEGDQRWRMRHWEVRRAARLPGRRKVSGGFDLITILPPHTWCHPANPEEYTLAVGHAYGPWKHICTSFCPLTNSEVSFIIPLPLIEIAMQIPFIKCDMDNFSWLHRDTIIFRAHGAGCKVSSDIRMTCLFNCSKCSMSGQFGGGHLEWFPVHFMSAATCECLLILAVRSGKGKRQFKVCVWLRMYEWEQEQSPPPPRQLFAEPCENP